MMGGRRLSNDSTQWSSRETRTRAGVIHWREMGPPGGLAVVFMHGILVNGHIWDNVVRQVAPQARCIVPDWPLGAHSHPMESDADLSVSGFVELMREFFESLQLERMILVANDSGGALTQIFLSRYADRVHGVVLTPCDAYDIWLPRLFKPLEIAATVPGGLWLFANLMRIPMMRRLPIAFGWLARRMPEDLSAKFALPWANSRHVRRDIGKFLRDLGPRHTLAAAKAFADIRIPVLIYWSTEDRVFPRRLAARLATEFPNAKLQWVSDAYTFVPIDQPADLALAINAFVLENGGASSVGTTGDPGISKTRIDRNQFK